MRLAGKVTIVTGGGTGIGRAIALRYAKEGARVVVANRTAQTGEETVRMIVSSGQEAMWVRTDVSQSQQVQRMIGTTVRSYGRLDVLVNNAAIQKFGTVVTTEEADWDEIMAINVKGMYLTAKYAIPHMIAQGGGSIINLSSVLGLVGDPDLAAYGASKAAILGLTYAMAQAHGRDNIRVNAICPGDVATPMVEEYFDEQPDPETARDRVAAEYALRRIATPAEIAGVALFLATDDSAFVTGAAIVSDGGVTSRVY